MPDVRISPNFSLRVDSEVQQTITGGPGRDPHLGFNPGKIAFEASVRVQIVQSLGSLLGSVKLGSDETQPPHDWQIGFYQIVHSLKRVVIRETRGAGFMAAASRNAPGPLGMGTSGYEYEQTTFVMPGAYRDASDTIAESDDPWYDTNVSGLENFKRTYQSIGTRIHLEPQHVKLAMADSPGIIPPAASRSAVHSVIGLKQEASFTTFLLLLDVPRHPGATGRNFVFILTGWTWTADFVYAEVGNRRPLTLGGIILTSRDTMPRFKRGMPYPDIPDRPVAKTILNGLHPVATRVSDIDSLLGV